MLLTSDGESFDEKEPTYDGAFAGIPVVLVLPLVLAFVSDALPVLLFALPFSAGDPAASAAAGGGGNHGGEVRPQSVRGG